mmetsp:Transcript_29877/g.79502  ORF Transcript_29877/g.79502 Transcript_29877/m.79502 type:complete len:311 (+) Transcript_29877:272-1204(+)
MARSLLWSELHCVPLASPSSLRCAGQCWQLLCPSSKHPGHWARDLRHVHRTADLRQLARKHVVRYFEPLGNLCLSRWSGVHCDGRSGLHCFHCRGHPHIGGARPHYTGLHGTPLRLPDCWAYHARELHVAFQCGDPSVHGGVDAFSELPPSVSAQDSDVAPQAGWCVVHTLLRPLPTCPQCVRCRGPLVAPWDSLAPDLAAVAGMDSFFGGWSRCGRPVPVVPHCNPHVLFWDREGTSTGGLEGSLPRLSCGIRRIRGRAAIKVGWFSTAPALQPQTAVVHHRREETRGTLTFADRFFRKHHLQELGLLI